MSIVNSSVTASNPVNAAFGHSNGKNKSHVFVCTAVRYTDSAYSFIILANVLCTLPSADLGNLFRCVTLPPVDVHSNKMHLLCWMKFGNSKFEVVKKV